MAQLGPGCNVKIEGVEFRINGLLGEGSFGAVWSAQVLSGQDAGREVAVKEIVCHSETELLRAAMERRLLKFVRGAGAAGSGLEDGSSAAAAARRFPSLVASEVEALGHELWQVRLAMTKLGGKPLESTLEACMEELQGPHADTQVAQAHRAATCQLAEASRCVRTMLQQLTPALEHLATRAHHRDITPRNVLLEIANGHHSWGLVDFGLAVDSSKWRSELLTHDIGGDGHYWPTSSWFVLAYGAHHLESYPALLQEYEQCLDLHALGITALRTLMELWSPRCQRMDADPHGDADWAMLAKMTRLRIAWARFWEDIANFWQPIFDAFACGGAEALENLKSNYAHAGVHHMVSADLCALRAALRDLRDTSTLPDLRAVCDALLVMIRPGKARQEIATWKEALAALSGRNTTAADSPGVSPKSQGRGPPLSQTALCDALMGELCRGGAGPAPPGSTQSTRSPQGSLWSSSSLRSPQHTPPGPCSHVPLIRAA